MTSEFEAKLGPWMQSVPVSPAALAHLRDVELPARRQRNWWPRLLPASASALVAVAVVVALWSALALRPSVAAVPPDPRAFAGDPRLARCVSGGPEPLAAFEMAHASDYRLHLPAMGLSPELDRSDPAFVVVFAPGTPLGGAGAGGGGGGLSVTASPSAQSPGPNVHDVCILVGTDPATADRLVYTSVDTTGLRANLSPAPTATDVPPSATATSPPPGSASVVTQDGLTLTVQPPAVVEPGIPATFSIELRNDRAVPAMLGGSSCFASLDITAPLPVDRTPSALTGKQATFRSWLLANAYGPGGVPALAPVDLSLVPTCGSSSAPDTSLPPGGTLKMSYSWPGYYARGFFVPPGPVSFSVSVNYDPQGNPPTYAPDFTGIPSNWSPVYKLLTVNGPVQIGAHDPVAVGPGQAVDAAISDPRFWGFASKQPTAVCLSNLFPTEASGVSLPAGPVWEVDYICDSPRRFAIASVDAYTGQVTGVDLCTDPCNR
jgi:hypothetical protein